MAGRSSRVATETQGEVYAYNGRPDGSTVAVKVYGGKVVRFPTDEPWKLGEKVVISLSRPTDEQRASFGLEEYKID